MSTADAGQLVQRRGRIALLILLALLLAAPFIGLYPVFMMKALCYAIFACAFNLLLGYTGLLSFGHAAYLGSAAYATGWLIRSAGWPPELGVLAGIGTGALIGLVVGAIAIRRQGIYFAMVTLALAQMVYFVCLQAPFTGGEDGLQGVPRGKLFGLVPLASDLTLYYVVLAVFVAVFLFIIRIVHSPYGQVLKAIRENEPRAISLGYDVDRYKLLAFVLSTALAGLAGSMKTIVLGFATLSDAHWSLSRRGHPDDAARRPRHLRRAGDRRLHHHRAAGFPRRPGRLVGHRHHRRDLRGLRARLPARRHRRTDRLAEAPQVASDLRRARPSRTIAAMKTTHRWLTATALLLACGSCRTPRRRNSYGRRRPLIGPGLRP